MGLEQSAAVVAAHVVIICACITILWRVVPWIVRSWGRLWELEAGPLLLGAGLEFASRGVESVYYASARIAKVLHPSIDMHGGVLAWVIAAERIAPLLACALFSMGLWRILDGAGGRELRRRSLRCAVAMTAIYLTALVWFW